jgi:hypothetical protein
LQYGNYYRLGESMHKVKQGGYIVVSDDKTEAMAVIIDDTPWHIRLKAPYQFKGLDENAVYKVTARPQSNVEKAIEFTATGDSLINGFIDIGNLKKYETDGSNYRDVFASRMLYFKKI